VVVVPTHPSSKHLAAVYGYDGKVRRYVGDIVPIDRKRLRKNPALNDTLWRRSGDRWYCLFKFRPYLLVFDGDFNQVAEFRLTGPEIEHREEEFRKYEPKGKFSLPPNHFTDMKFFDGKLFVMAELALYQIDPATGDTLNRTYFIGRGEGFGEIEGHPLALMHFAFLDDGTLVLGHPAVPWNHDLWKVRLPQLEKSIR